ncbi:MAG: hypothetical protein ACI8RZ_001166 [Myxococcota bacterium]|jgi:hypothetical protein
MTSSRRSVSPAWLVAVSLFAGVVFEGGCGTDTQEDGPAADGPGTNQDTGPAADGPDTNQDTGPELTAYTSLRSVARAEDGSWLAVGAGWSINPETYEYTDIPGLIFHSPDGHDWEVVHRLDDWVFAWDVTRFDGNWLVSVEDTEADKGSVLLSSADGTSWEAVATLPGQVTQLESGAGVVVAAGVVHWRGSYHRSSDGRTWEVVGEEIENYSSNLVYGDGFVFNAGFEFWQSADGATWTSTHLQTDLGLGEVNTESVVWTGEEFIGTGLDDFYDYYGSYVRHYLLRSPDGVSWTSKELAEAFPISAVRRLRDVWYGVQDSKVVSSEDLVTWTTVYEYEGDWLKDLKLGPDIWVATGDGIVVSEDQGGTWEVVVAPGVY